jgi:hypothetical protein
MKKQLSSIWGHKNPDILFTSNNTPHITIGSVQCLKILLGVCNIKKWGDLSISLAFVKLSRIDCASDFHCQQNPVASMYLLRLIRELCVSLALRLHECVQ